MADQQQVVMLRDSVWEWNQWRENHPDAVIDLSHVDLSEAKLVGLDLSMADLTRADLSRADLRGTRLAKAVLTSAILSSTDLNGATLSDAFLSADLSYANLSYANLGRAFLRDASLNQANLNFTNLNHADLSNADLTGANLNSTDLTCATLDGAFLGWTTLGNIDLRQVQGLDAVRHVGPSHLATDVFYKSHGEIPDIFLRGCGLPDELVDFARSIAGAIQYYSAFISYNHQDEAFATRLYNDLQANNVRCWKYTENMKIGDRIHHEVDRAIRLHDKLLVIFSEHAVCSDWVAGEVETALERERREGKQILFPVTVDDTMKYTHFGWAATIRRARNIGDFRAWKDQEQYQPKFERLLRDLKQASTV